MATPVLGRLHSSATKRFWLLLRAKDQAAFATPWGSNSQIIWDTAAGLSSNAPETVFSEIVLSNPVERIVFLCFGKKTNAQCSCRRVVFGCIWNDFNANSEPFGDRHRGGSRGILPRGHVTWCDMMSIEIISNTSRIPITSNELCWNPFSGQTPLGYII